MKTEEEINARIKNIQGYLKLSQEFGKHNNMEKNKLNKEMQVLSWVLEEESLPLGIISYEPVRDKVISYLREQTESKSFNEIFYNLDIAPGSLNSALRTLTIEGKIKRTGEPRRYRYSMFLEKEEEEHEG